MHTSMHRSISLRQVEPVRPVRRGYYSVDLHFGCDSRMLYGPVSMGTTYTAAQACTAKHSICRRVGGSTRAGNAVAACVFGGSDVGIRAVVWGWMVGRGHCKFTAGQAETPCCGSVIFAMHACEMILHECSQLCISDTLDFVVFQGCRLINVRGLLACSICHFGSLALQHQQQQREQLLITDAEGVRV